MRTVNLGAKEKILFTSSIILAIIALPRLFNVASSMMKSVLAMVIRRASSDDRKWNERPTTEHSPPNSSAGSVLVPSSTSPRPLIYNIFGPEFYLLHSRRQLVAAFRE